MSTFPGWYEVTFVASVKGPGRDWRSCEEATRAEVSNSAARLTSNRGFRIVASTWLSGAFTATGVTHAYGFVWLNWNRYVVSPDALTTGPFTLVVFPTKGSSGISVRKYLVLVSARTFGEKTRLSSPVNAVKTLNRPSWFP